MKSKNEKGTAKNDSTQNQSNRNTSKKSAPGHPSSSSATDNTKARSGRGSSNEGTNVSYEEER